MVTLRKAYHDIGNEMHSVTMMAGVVKDMCESFKEEPNNKDLVESIVKNAALIESKIINVDRKISDLRKVIYRSIDPDVDIQIHLDKIKEENKKIKIFIVDDEQVITEELTKRHAADGYSIAYALNGEDAIKKIEEFEPSILMTDIYMPGPVGGVEVIKFVKEKMKWVQILVVTRADDEKVIKELKALGVDEILIKPVKFSDINAKISGMIQTLKR